MKMENKKLKIGVIGTGNISQFHLKSYAADPRVEIYALCDLNRERAEKAAKEYGVPAERVFTDVHDLVALPEVDAVSVCTWNNGHAPCTIAALKAGKHVLCEKPMAMNADEAKAMKKAADEAGKLLQIGFVRRYGNDCATTKDFLEADYFGDIYYAKTTYLRRNGNPGGWFGDKSRSGGGPLIDLGVHVIDLVRYLMGNPRAVSVYGATFHKLGNREGLTAGKDYVSASATQKDPCDVEDMATALIRFDNGAVLSVEASFCLNLKSDRGSIELFGTKAGAKLEPEFELYSDANGHLVNTTLSGEGALPFDQLFAREVNHFVDCIVDGAACKAPAADGVALMEILDAIYESAETGHEVLIK